jgi:dihydroorotate dehydrogenase electron transfer subunit
MTAPSPSTTQQTATISSNEKLQSQYFQIDLSVEKIPAMAGPGQFVHVQLPAFNHRVLRRPFSIFDVDATDNRLSIVYKVVGEGTQHLSRLQEGESLDLLGPLGNGFSLPPANTRPVIVAGGYGSAATYMLSKYADIPPVYLLGGRSAEDLLLIDTLQAAGCDVQVATDDGSKGHKGVVTDLLQARLQNSAEPAGPIYACGPIPMLKTVGKIVLQHGLDAEVSLDHEMACGIGACLACVVRMRDDSPQGWSYVRTCKDGPVFKASNVAWEEV